MPGRWGETPFAALTLFLAAGIVASRILTGYSYSALVAGNAALIAAALLALLRDRCRAALALGLAAVFTSGVLLALAWRDGYSARDLRALLRSNAFPLGELTPIEGCVTARMNRRPDESVATISLRAFQKDGEWIPSRGGMILRIPEGPAGPGVPVTPDLRIGDRVRGWATCQVPRNFRNPGSPDHAGLLLRRGISLIGRTRSGRLLEVIPGDCADAWTRAASAIRGGLQQDLDRLRQAGGREQAAILASLILGDYSDLSTDTREEFQNSGTYHVLVVSGLHVAWIAAVLLHLCRWARIPQGAGRFLVAALVLVYTGLVGFQASISRALWMFILCLAGQACFRRAAPANITSAAAFFLLAARPDWIFDIGFQLSFLSVLAICLTGIPLIEEYLKPLLEPLKQAGRIERLDLRMGLLRRAGRRLRTRCELVAEACGDHWHSVLEPALLAVGRGLSRMLLTVGSMIAVTVSVQIWLEPVLAYHFNRLSWIAPAANLFAVPLSSLVLAAGMAGALASRLAPLSSFLLGVAASLSSLLLMAARFVSGLPGAWQRCPTPPLCVVLMGAALLFAWKFMEWRRGWIPWLWVGLLLACLSSGLPRLGPPTLSKSNKGGRPALRITFLDVGEGDSIVLVLPDGRVWIVDAGGIRQSRSEEETDKGFDVGEAVVSRYLWSQWTSRLDRVILSHPDQDHAGGMPAILENFRTRRVDYGEATSDPYLARVLRAATERGTGLRQVRAGDALEHGDPGVEVLNPFDGEGRSTNENSVVLRLDYGRFSALLTGDLEKSGERDFLSRQQCRPGLLLKAAHHGSRNATTDPMIDCILPRWAVLSSGRNNPFGHPSGEVISRLLRRGTRLLLTQDLGAITFETDGVRYLVASHVTGIIEQGFLPGPTHSRKSAGRIETGATQKLTAETQSTQSRDDYN